MNKGLENIIEALGDSKRCIIQNTNMNEHCIYSISQINSAIETARDLIQDNEVDVSLQEIIGVVAEGINDELESILTEGLRLKGFEFEDRSCLESFLRERCRCEDNSYLKEKVYFVDDIPFFLHNYSEEFRINKDDDSGIFIANYGSFKYL